jgi:hypothetical protein
MRSVLALAFDPVVSFTAAGSCSKYCSEQCNHSSLQVPPWQPEQLPDGHGLQLYRGHAVLLPGRHPTAQLHQLHRLRKLLLQGRRSYPPVEYLWPALSPVWRQLLRLHDWQPPGPVRNNPGLSIRSTWNRRGVLVR